MKDRILFVLAYAEAPMDLPTLKECLIEEFGPMKAFNKNLTKALALLGSSPRTDFVTDGETYHGGEARAAVRDAEAANENAEESDSDGPIPDERDPEQEGAHIDMGYVKCCFCGSWCDPSESGVGISNKFRCCYCDKVFWRWHGDADDVTHEVSYTMARKNGSI